MSATALLGVGTKALFAAYRQVHTIGNNIANANTAGYSRQEAVQATSLSLSTGQGFVGTGVDVTTIQRASNLFLAAQSAALRSTSAADAVSSNLMSQLESSFPSGEAGLGYATTELFNAFSDLAAAPADLSARQAVIGRMDEFASLVRATGAQVEALQANVNSDLAGGVAEVNALADQLATLNRQIQFSKGQGHDPNDLLDQRDMLVGKLADQIDLQTVNSADGTVAVFVAGGETLVLGDQANHLVLQRDDLDASRMGVAIAIGSQRTVLGEQHIGEGKIGGLLRFQNTDLADARNKLGQLVVGVATALNDQQARGIDLNGDGGGALFDIVAPQAVPASGNARDASGNVISSISLEVDDASALQASDYELEADAANPGKYIVTRRADGKVFSPVSSGDVVDGLRISDGTTAPVAGERFLLRGVGQVATGLTVALRDPRGLAAASPVTVTVNRNNTGTLGVAGLDVVADPASGSGFTKTDLRFIDDNGGYQLFDTASGNQIGSGSFTPGQTITVDGVQLTVTGVPKSGDTLTLAPTSYTQSNNGNALTMAGLGLRKLVDQQTAGDAYASLFSGIGVRTQGASIAADNSAAAASRAKAALTGETGVNVDEEAARLIQYQQSYQAAAKILQTAQSLMDTVLGLANG